MSPRPQPKLVDVILADWLVFMMVVLSCVFSLVALVSFLVFEYPYPDYNVVEFAGAVLAIGMISQTPSPIILWWHFSIKRTLKNGIEIDGQITRKTGCGMPLFPYVGLYYEFIHQGIKYEKVVDVVNGKKAVDLCEKNNITVYFNPDNKLAFIREIFD